MNKLQMKNRIVELERELAELKGQPKIENHYHYHYENKTAAVVPYQPIYPSYPPQPWTVTGGLASGKIEVHS